MNENIGPNFEKDYNEASKLCKEIMKVNGRTCERCPIQEQAEVDINCDYIHFKNKKINYV